MALMLVNQGKKWGQYLQSKYSMRIIPRNLQAGPKTKKLDKSCKYNYTSQAPQDKGRKEIQVMKCRKKINF